MARNSEQFRQSRRHRLAMLIEHGGRAGLDDFLDFRCQVFTDAGQFREILTLGDHPDNLPGKIAKRASRITAGANAEQIGAFDL